ncbi:extracellular solute-binding protein [Vallitaleaceae bacterium 9-2]
MKKVYRKILSLALVTFLLFGMTACGEADTTPDASETSKEETVPELTVHGMWDSSQILDFSTPVLQEIQKQAGVKLVNTVPTSATDVDQTWTLMMSTPDQMPDIIINSQISKMEKLGMDGGLISLESLIEEHAPNIQKIFEEHPELLAASTAADGHIYHVASMKELKTSTTWVIRQDWIDNLGLETPETIDDLYNVLYAFKYEDPNGNGEQDEQPFISRLSGKDFTNTFLSLFDSSLQLMVRDGVVMYDPLGEDFKYGMEQAIKWYDEGIIDQEIFTRGKESRNVMYGENKGGFICDWIPSTVQYNDSLADTIPGFKNVALAPPIDQNGNQKVKWLTAPYAGPGISSNCEDPVAAIKFIDFMYSDAGRMLDGFGIEGDTYTIDADGNPQFTDKVKGYEGGIGAGRKALGMMARLGCIDSIEMEYAGIFNTLAQEGIEMHMANPQWYPQDEYLNFQFKYTAEESQEIAIIQSGLDAYVAEKTTSWILGNGDFNAEYEDFVNEIKQRDVDRLIDISQAAYDRVAKSN